MLPMGLAALLLQSWRPVALQIGTAVVLMVLAGASAIDHVRVIHHWYQRSAPLRFADAAERLRARGVTTGRAGYWRAYAIAFLTREQVRLTSTEVLRIQEYRGPGRQRRAPSPETAGSAVQRRRAGGAGRRLVPVWPLKSVTRR